MDAEKAEQQVAEAADREIITTPIIDAPRELVWEAFADPKALARWYGPKGSTLTTKVFEIQEGGDWIFDLWEPRLYVIADLLTTGLPVSAKKAWTS